MRERITPLISDWLIVADGARSPIRRMPSWNTREFSR